MYIKAMGDEREREEDRDLSRLLVGIMEGYSDSVIPSLSQFSPTVHETAIDEKGSSSRKRSKPTAEDSTEIRIESSQKERDRREKMTEMFSMLHSVVPNLFPKTTREKIVGDTIEYIRCLEKERERLEELKKSSAEAMGGKISQCTNWKSSVSVAVSGNIVLFEIHSWVRRRLVMDIFMVFDKYQAEILAANIAVNEGQLVLSVTAFVNDTDEGNTVEWIKRDILIL